MDDKKEESKYGVLTINELKSLKLFSADNNDIYDDCYSNASFDFTLGNEFFFPKQYQDALNEEIKIKNVDNINSLPDTDREKILQSQIRSCKANNSVLVIPRFSSVVITTYESVNLPDNVAGRFDLRLKWAMAGFILQVGTQIEPGYKGPLWGLLHNFSDEDILISYHNKDHRLLTGEFYYTSSPTPPNAKKLNKPSTLLDLLQKYSAKSGSLQNYFDEFKNIQNLFETEVQNEINAIDKSRKEFQNLISNQINSELSRISRLKEDVATSKTEAQGLTTEARNLIDKVNDRRNFTLSIAIAIITFGLAIGLPLTIPWATQSMENYHKDIKMQNQTIDSLKTKVDSLESKVVNLQKQLKNR